MISEIYEPGLEQPWGAPLPVAEDWQREVVRVVAKIRQEVFDRLESVRRSSFIPTEPMRPEDVQRLILETMRIIYRPPINMNYVTQKVRVI